MDPRASSWPTPAPKPKLEFLSSVTTPRGVFGSSRTDLLILVLPVALAMLVGAAFISYGPEQPPYWFYPILVLLLDGPHVACGYWVMLTTPTGQNGLRRTMLALPLLFFALFYACVLNGHQVYVFTVLSVSSIWHFIRQHQTWFDLSMRSQRGTWTRRFNRAGIFAVTWGFTLIGLCGEDVVGWYVVNDIPTLPAAWKGTMSVVVGMMVSAYMGHHAWLCLKGRGAPWSAHLVWLGAAVVWGVCRLWDSPIYFTSLLLIFSHSVSYFFLLGRYLGRKGRGLAWLGAGYLLGLGYNVYLHGPSLMSGLWKHGDIIIAFSSAIAVAHYLQDKIYWNRHHNPGWAEGVISA